jgi:nucleotide-binding universal stress UspA family protein
LDVREEAAHVIDEAKKELAGTNIQVKYTIVSGTVNDEIATNLPEKEEIDLIVLGKSGKSALEKLIVGSVTKYVVQHAEVPVLVTEAASE